MDLADANLQFTVTSTGVEKTKTGLADLVGVTAKAERATESLAASQKRSSSATAQMQASMEKAIAQVQRLEREMSALRQAHEAQAASVAALTAKVAAFEAMGGRINRMHSQGAAGAKIHSAEMLNLSRQFSDIAVTGAMGMNPLMILIQQGPQVTENLTAMAARGVTLSGALKQIAVEGWAALAPFAPFIAAAAAATGGMYLYSRAISDHAVVSAQTDSVTKNLTKSTDAYAKAAKAAAEASNADRFALLQKAQQARATAAADREAARAALARAEADYAGQAASGLGEAAGPGSQVFSDLDRLQQGMRDAKKALADADKDVAKASAAAREAEAALVQTAKERLFLQGRSTAEAMKVQAVLEAAKFSDAGLRESYLKTNFALADKIAAEEAVKDSVRDATRAEREHTKAIKEKEKAIEAANRRIDVQIRPFNFAASEMLAAISPPSMAAYGSALQKQGEAVFGNVTTVATAANKTLEETYDRWRDIGAIADETGRAMSDAFGRTGDAIADAMTLLLNYKFHMLDIQKRIAATDPRDTKALNALLVEQQAGKIAAYAGIANVAGNAIGGGTGRAISGAAAGAASGAGLVATLTTAGASLGPITAVAGAVIGGVVGLIGSIFGNSAKKKQAEAEKAQKEAERLEKIAQQGAELRLKQLQLEGKYLDAAKASREAYFKGIAAENTALAQATYNLERAADFRSRFNSPEEQMAESRAMLSKELESLGLSIDLTRDQYKALVNAGGELGASLLDLLEPFDAFTQAAKEAAATMEEAAIDFYVQGILAENAARENQRRDLLAWTKSDNGPTSAETRAKLAEAATAWMELEGQLDAATAAAVKAGDFMAALASETRRAYADPAQANYLRDQGTFRDGSFNAGGFNAAYARVQADAAKQLLGTFQAISIQIPNVRDVFESLLDTMERVNSPEFGGMGSAAGPVQGGGLYGALRRYGFYAATTDSSGAAGTGYGYDVNDGVNNLTRAQQLARIADAAAEIAREAQLQINSVFGQLTKGVQALDAAAKAAGEPIAMLTGAIGRFKSIAELTLDGFQYATPEFQASATGGNALLVSQAAAIAAKVLTTQEAKATAEALGVTRDVALLIDGIRAWDPQSFENSFIRLSDALGRGAITQDEYTRLYNRGLDVYEGLIDATGKATDGLKGLADQLKLDERLSPLSVTERLAEAQRQFGLNRNESTARSLLELLQQTAGSEAEYRVNAGQVIGSLGETSTPRLQVETDNTGMEQRLDALNTKMEEMRNENTQLLFKVVEYTRGMEDVLEASFEGGLPLAVTITDRQGNPVNS